MLPEQLIASLALPEPAAAIDEGAWRAAETIEALEGLTFGEAIAPPATIECFDISHFCGLQTVGASSAFDRGVLAPDRYGWYSLSDGPPDDPAAIARSVTQRLEETDPPDPLDTLGDRADTSHRAPACLLYTSPSPRDRG